MTSRSPVTVYPSPLERLAFARQRRSAVAWYVFGVGCVAVAVGLLLAGWLS